MFNTYFLPPYFGKRAAVSRRPFIDLAYYVTFSRHFLLLLLSFGVLFGGFVLRYFLSGDTTTGSASQLVAEQL